MTLTILTRPRAKKLAVLYDLSLILIGSWLIALAAQIAVSLPFSPVPISGQTFAVLFVGALLGRRLAALTVSLSDSRAFGFAGVCRRDERAEPSSRSNRGISSWLLVGGFLRRISSRTGLDSFRWQDLVGHDLRECSHLSLRGFLFVPLPWVRESDNGGLVSFPRW